MNNELSQISYVLGTQVGTDLKNQEIEIELDTFFDAITDAYNGNSPKMSQEEMGMAMAKLQASLQEKAAAKAGKEGEQNLQEGLNYLTQNQSKEDVITTDSGLQYKVLQKGSGKSPSATCTVETHYEGKLIDGTIFDSSYQRGQTTSFPVNRVIAGWTEALQLMQEGDVWELTIPSVLAYGSQGAGGIIGPNATLIFKVELVKVL